MAALDARVPDAIDTSFASVTIALVDIPVEAAKVFALVTAKLTLASSAGTGRRGVAGLLDYV